MTFTTLLCYVKLFNHCFMLQQETIEKSTHYAKHTESGLDGTHV